MGFRWAPSYKFGKYNFEAGISHFRASEITRQKYSLLRVGVNQKYCNERSEWNKLVCFALSRGLKNRL